jgi:stage II sporulation protein D
MAMASAALVGAAVTAACLQSRAPRGGGVLLAIDRPARVASLPAVRVRLTPKPVSTIDVRVEGPYRVQPVDDWRVLAQSDRLNRATVEVLPDGFRIGARTFPVTRLELIPIRHPTLWVGDAQYRGTVRFERQSGGTMLVVNAVDLEDYLSSVLNSELPADFPAAARQTQAIAARTYALYQMKTASASGAYDLRNDSQSQVYRGVQYREGGRALAVETDDSQRIVDQTRGIVATYEGRLFCTYYSAICGGRTTQGGDIFEDAAPPLSSVPCHWCRAGKYYRWEHEVAGPALEQRIRTWISGARGGSGPARIGALQRIEVIGDGQTGRVPQVRLLGDAGSTQVSAYAFRLAVDPRALKSGFFQVEQRGGVYRFQGRGWGHGVGLCQWGARGQALEGRSCIEILEYYYPGSTLVAVQ